MLSFALGMFFVGAEFTNLAIKVDIAQNKTRHKGQKAKDAKINQGDIERIKECK